MHTRNRLLAILIPLGILALCFFSIARDYHAQTTPACSPTHPIAIDRWRGEYFNNPNLQGAPVMIRDDGNGEIDFDWGLGGPSAECNVPVDLFSVRWTRIIAFAGSPYRFTITSDDGVRLLIDGKQVFAKWSDHPLTTDSVEVDLSAGNHKVTLEYNETMGSAVARLSWQAHPCIATVSPDRWRGEYFNNNNLSGPPRMVRDDGDGTLLFDYREAGPAQCGITLFNYSARWARQVALGQGLYRFEGVSDGGMRILVDKQLRLDRWNEDHTNTGSFDLFLPAGNHEVIFEYRRAGARSRGVLTWKSVPCNETVPENNWRGEYFNSDTPTGTPVAIRDDGRDAIDFDWSQTSPGSSCGVRQKSFSVRWTRAEIFSGGVYHFDLQGEGGVKFTIDGETKFDKWSPAAFRTSIEVEFTPGTHRLAVEFGALTDKPKIKLTWEDPPCIDTSVPPDRWRAEYFQNPDLSGKPVVIRNEGVRMIDLGDGLNRPQTRCALMKDEFSTRWSRTASFDATTYRFTVRADDGVRLFVDNRLVIDAWRDQYETSYTADVELTAGKHRVVMEYYNRFGAAVAHLSWTAAPCAAAVQEGNWRGEYFDNADLTGKPVMTRDDGSGGIEFDWGLQGPEAACKLPVDIFSARWTRTAAFSEGLYRFHFTGDDGVRVLVDGKTVFEAWRDQMASHSFDLALTAGNHRLTVEYFEHWGSAAIQFSWQRHPCFADVPPDHWRGEYFNQLNPTGAPALVRDEGEGGLNFQWNAESPAPACGLIPDGFSARWSRKVIFDTGWQRFTITADDGVRLYIDGRKVLDEWRNQPPATFTIDVNLPAGSHRIVMEYYEQTGSATARLDWEKAPAKN